MERIQPPAPRTGEESSSVEVPAARDPARLRGLLAQLEAGVLAEKVRAADQINALLIAMRARGNEAAEAKAVLEALERGAFGDAMDSRGRLCRAEAVETLMACGFPHALQVRPEDLAFRTDAKALAKTAIPVAVLCGAGVWLVTVFSLWAFVPGVKTVEALGMGYALGAVVGVIVNRLGRIPPKPKQGG